MILASRGFLWTRRYCNGFRLDSSPRQPWRFYPAAIRSVADVLSASGQPLALDAIAGHFNARGRWRERLPTILETLAALGRARKVDGERWDARLS